MQTNFFIVRHGQSIGNAWKRYLGHTDLGLSELGHKQAKDAAIALAEQKIDLIYSSDLRRAHETAVPHAQIHGLDIIDTKEFREVNVGDWEGMAVADLKKLYYQEFVIDWQGKFGTFKFPNGESVLHAAERFYNEIKRIADLNPGKNIIITSHAAVIRAFWCKICGIAPEDMAKAYPFPVNASYSTLTYDGEKFTPIRYSVDDHLQTISVLE